MKNMFKCGVSFVILVILLAGCARTQIPRETPPHSPSTITPSTKLVRPPSRNVRRIHEHLLQEGKGHIREQRYSEAIRDLERLLALNPQESMEWQGRWLLGQAYSHTQDWKRAQGQYQAILASPTPNTYQNDAQDKLTEIYKHLPGKALPPRATHAIRLSLEQLPTAEGFDQGLERMKGDGVTALLVDLGCKAKVVRSSQATTAARALSRGELRTLLRSYVNRAHRQDISVFLGVNIRCLGHWHENPQEIWRDRTFNVRTRNFEDTDFFDVFHPSYQRFMKSMVFDLSKSEIDGVVFLKDYPMGLNDGVSHVALKTFRKAFGETFDPFTTFSSGFDPIGDQKYAAKGSLRKSNSTNQTTFWRWVGWKAREQLSIVESIMRALPQEASSLVFGLELHPHGFTDPVRALLAYSEDSLDAIQRPFGFFFVRPEIDRTSTFEQPAVTEKLRRISTKAVLKRLLPAVNDPKRIWLSVPSRDGSLLRSRQVKQRGDTPNTLPSGVGVVHDLRTLS